MKFLILTLFVATALISDEMQRIEAIIDDISKLRVSYEECKKELNSKQESVLSIVEMRLKNCNQELEKVEKNQISFEKEKQKNTILQKNMDSMENLKKSNNNLKNKIIKYENSLKIKDIEIKKLKNRLNNKKCKPKIITKRIENSNIFPKLIMKEKYKVKEAYNNIESFKASAFRLIVDSDIYDAIDGKVVLQWERDRSFTSNQGSDNWVKITGYFIDRKWRKAKKDLWIEKKKVLQR